MQDYMGEAQPQRQPQQSGQSGQHMCACNTPAGTSQVSGNMMPGYNVGISQGGSMNMQGMSTTPSPSLMPIPAGTTTLDSTQFLNGYLQTMIGKNVTVEFLFGTGTLSDRTGMLMNVGANFITIREIGSNNLLICDFFSIKLVRVYQGTTGMIG